MKKGEIKVTITCGQCGKEVILPFLYHARPDTVAVQHGWKRTERHGWVCLSCKPVESFHKWLGSATHARIGGTT